MNTQKLIQPLVSVGAKEPLADQMMLADYFRMPIPFSAGAVKLTSGRWDRRPGWNSLKRKLYWLPAMQPLTH